MNTRPLHTRLFSPLLGAGLICLFLVSGSSTVSAAANSNSCALLKPADLSTLLGKTPIA